MENNTIPRRAKIYMYVPAETAIRKALLEVEKIGADVRLTKAVNLLSEAKDVLSDYVDEKELFNEDQIDLDFGQAIAALKIGRKVRRKGWNGKGMFLLLVKGDDWKLPDTGVMDNTIIPNCDFIGMKTADNKFVPWLASQTDVLAEDWEIIKNNSQS